MKKYPDGNRNRRMRIQEFGQQYTAIALTSYTPSNPLVLYWKGHRLRLGHGSLQWHKIFRRVSTEIQGTGCPMGERKPYP